MDSKFDERLNQLYSNLLSEMGDTRPAPGAEPDSEGEEDVTVSDNEMANARRYVNRKKVLGLNVGQSRQVKKQLQRKAKLDQELEDVVMPDILDRLQRGNDATQAEIDAKA
jgi:hypothetical protein